MRAKNIATLILAVIFIVTVTGGCNYKKLKEIKATGWSVNSVSLRGLRSLDANVSIELDNPAMGVTLSDIQGLIYFDGEPFVHYTVNELKLDAKCVKTYSSDCSLVLDTSKNILDVLAILPEMSSKHLTTDISAKARIKAGLTKTFSFKNVPIKRLLGK